MVICLAGSKWSPHPGLAGSEWSLYPAWRLRYVVEMNIKISVFLVAGNRLLREALARLLSKRGDFDVCGVSPCVPEAMSSIAALGTDVLILDSITAQVSDYALIAEI